MHGVVAFVAFGTLIVFAAQGFRNRSGPRWLALFGILALVLAIEDEWWRIKCYAAPGLLLGLIWLAVAGLLLHQAVQGGRKSSPPDTERRSLSRLALDAVLLAFTLVFVTWFCVFQTALLVAHHDPQVAAMIVSKVQRWIGWPASAMLPVAAFATLQRVVTSEGNAERL
jgi:hypothetical protein